MLIIFNIMQTYKTSELAILNHLKQQLLRYYLIRYYENVIIELTFPSSGLCTSYTISPSQETIQSRVPTIAAEI